MQSNTDLFGRLVHDVRTPLGVIVGYANLLASGEPGPLTGKQTRMLIRIQAAAAQLEGLLVRAEAAKNPEPDRAHL